VTVIFLVSLAMTIASCPSTDAWYAFECALLNFRMVPNCTVLSFLPGFNDSCRVTMAAPIPKVSLTGNGPTSGKSLSPKPNELAISSLPLHLVNVRETVQVPGPRGPLNLLA